MAIPGSRRTHHWSTVALWGAWLLAAAGGMAAASRSWPPAALRACLTTVALAYAWLVSWAWLHTPGWNAVMLVTAAVFSLVWMAAAATHGWILSYIWLVAGAAALTATVQHHRLRRWRQLDLVQERLEEAQQQCRADVAHVEQSLAGLKRRLERYRALQDVARQFSIPVALDHVCRLIVTQTLQMIGKSSACLLFLIDRATQSLALTASHRGPDVTALPAKRGDVFDQTVMRTRRGLLVEDVTKDARCVPEEFQGRRVHALLATPLLVDRRVEGVLRLESAVSGSYTQEDLRVLDLLGELGSTAIATAQLYAQTQELAMTDGLTGVLVRRALQDGLRKELLRAARRGELRAVLMVDIDHFKRYNDALGHAAGDLVLKGVARILKDRAGTDGLVARYGGEEFTVVLPATSAAHALEQGEAIRRAIADEPFILRREATHVTISLGIAIYPDDGREPVELLRVADDRLYRAKQAGRNRVCAT